MEGTRRRIGRVIGGAVAVLAVGAALEAALVVSCRLQWRTVLEPGPARLDEVVAAVLALAAVLVGAWLTATAVVALLAHLPGRLGRGLDAWSRSWSPALARRVATVLVGASVTGVVAPGAAAGVVSPAPVPGFSATAPVAVGTASAPGFSSTAPVTVSTASAPAPTWSPPTTDDPSAPGFAPTASPQPTASPEPPAAGEAPVTGEVPVPGWVPPRPVVRPQPAPHLVAGPGRQAPAEVVVLRGDSLWSIVARHLGPEATDAEVAEAWPRWWAANRSVVGADPDLLLPGQVLSVPRDAAVTR
ncbi:hypothetical protein GCM10027517_02780 [Phycicoccus ginsengisoli]